MTDFAPLTLLTPDRIRTIADLAIQCRSLPGNVAELGVYRGGVSIMLAQLLPLKTVYAFDTFCGIPNANPAFDVHRNGEFADVGDVLATLAEYRNIAPVIGVFPASAEGIEGQFCVAHFDGDTYQSCVDFIAYFVPRMVVGGVLIFDDFGWTKCQGVTKAINEAFEPSRINTPNAMQCHIGF